MKVNINGIWYDAEKTPIQIQLSKSDKNNIANMHEDKFNYICFPDSMKWEEVENNLKPKPQICYKSNEVCAYDCKGLCKESC
ncbi:MAG: hypothetical protein H7Y10_12190 [Flavobacterium sp.]|nr:hypothetical protein [Flavobacterium sp.]